MLVDVEIIIRVCEPVLAFLLLSVLLELEFPETKAKDINWLRSLHNLTVYIPEKFWIVRLSSKATSNSVVNWHLPSDLESPAPFIPRVRLPFFTISCIKDTTPS